MTTCVHQQKRETDPMGRETIRCAVLDAFCGFHVRMQDTVCRKCAHRGDALVAQPDPLADAVFKRLCLKLLAIRLRNGELPKFSHSHKLNMRSEFTRFRSVAGDESARTLFDDMVYHQATVNVSDGGMDAQALALKLSAVAQDHSDILSLP